MRIAVVGGGPAGLAFAIFAKSLAPDWQVAVWERNAPSSGGFGLVMPDRAVDRLAEWDPALGSAVAGIATRWDRIDVRYRGHRVSSDGHGYRAVGRAELLAAMRNRCAELGVQLHLGRLGPVERLLPEVDLLVGADGTHSAVRRRLAAEFAGRSWAGRCRFIWTRVEKDLDAFGFHVIESGQGVICLHTYPYAPGRGTVIVEMHDDVWRRFHPAGPDLPPPTALAPALTRVLRDALAGTPLHVDGPDWQRFVSVRTDRWFAGNVVLLGDAAHAAHFSIGSGTKLAVEDARTLAECLIEQALPAALARYQEVRLPAVTALQQAAEASQHWFEGLAGHCGPDPVVFAELLLTRSGRMPAHRLDLRCSRQPGLDGQPNTATTAGASSPIPAGA